MIDAASARATLMTSPPGAVYRFSFGGGQLNSELVWIFAPFPALLQGRCEGCDFKAANAMVQSVLMRRSGIRATCPTRSSLRLDIQCLRNRLNCRALAGNRFRELLGSPEAWLLRRGI